MKGLFSKAMLQNFEQIEKMISWNCRFLSECCLYSELLRKVLSVLSTNNPWIFQEVEVVGLALGVTTALVKNAFQEEPMPGYSKSKLI